MATTNEKSGFTGNVERSISLSKWGEIAKMTANKPVKVAARDGATLYKVEVGIVIDTCFPTKAGNVTTAMVVVPLAGGKDFPIDGGKVVMDGIPPFIYQGRGVSHVFTAYSDSGDVVKRHNSRKSAATEVAELKRQLDAIMALLSKQ